MTRKHTGRRRDTHEETVLSVATCYGRRREGGHIRGGAVLCRARVCELACELTSSNCATGWARTVQAVVMDRAASRAGTRFPPLEWRPVWQSVAHPVPKPHLAVLAVVVTLPVVRIYTPSYSHEVSSMRRVLMTVLAVFTLSGCYHATVNTGVTPGTRQIEQPWAASWIIGLVPPPTVDAMSECGSAGVARVETQQSFLNGLVSLLTFSIFTPMEITVTCGQGEQEDLEEVTDAAGLSTALQSGQPFLIRPLG